MMRNFLQFFFLITLVFDIQFLSAIHLGNVDTEECELNNTSGKTVRKRKVIIDFKQEKPQDLLELDTFGQENLLEKLRSRINKSSSIDQYQKSNLTVSFRNINNHNHTAAARLTMKGLGYSKYSSNEPSIIFENPNKEVETNVQGIIEEYFGDGLK